MPIVESIYPEKLSEGDMVRVIAPAFSMAIIDIEIREIAQKHFEEELGLDVSYGSNAELIDKFNSSPIEARVDDFHEAISDKKVKAIFSIIGGTNGNQILRKIDWDLVVRNPKIVCGFSDITTLQNAIYQQCGLVTYSGPHFSTFGQKIFDSYTSDYLKMALFSNDPYCISPSKEWTDDEWYLEQNVRVPIANGGYWNIQNGHACGTSIGGNLCTLNLLQGTEFFPDAEEPIVFIEDTYESSARSIDRDLQSLLHAKRVGGLIIGRFQNGSNVDKSTIEAIIASKDELHGIPVVANVDFGHTLPITTFPIGGSVAMNINEGVLNIEVTRH